MTFVLKMLARELRSSWRRLVFFFVCVAVGVGAIVAIRSPKTPVGHARRVSPGPNMLVTAASRLPVPDEPNNNTSPVVAKIDCMRSAMLWSRRAYSGPR